MSAALQRLIADVADAVRSARPCQGEVARALASNIGNPYLLAGCCVAGDPARYVRHCLHHDAEASYAIAAIVWMPGQRSPAHGHRTWCAFGVQCGNLIETYYDGVGGMAHPCASHLRVPGAVCHAAADPAAIHSLSNDRRETAISIHVYGVGYDQFGSGVNEVWRIAEPVA